jgi:steroid delta-isomerase
MTSRVTEHSRLFNEAVRDGSWDTFIASFTPDAVMRFEGVPTGPCEGRDAIAAFYAASPPTSTMTVVSVASGDNTNVVRFTWDDGHGGGTLRVRWHDNQVADVTVTLQPESGAGGRTVP